MIGAPAIVTSSGELRLRLERACVHCRCDSLYIKLCDALRMASDSAYSINRISLKGVAIGNITDIVATYVVMLPLIISIAVSSGLPPAEVLKGSTVFYVSYTILGGICSVLGGYVAARIAKHDELLNGALSAILCVGGGMYAVISGRTIYGCISFSCR